MKDKTMTELIRFDQVSFTYEGDEQPVWKELDCSFKEHTINLILGPSGCGKSTLLQMLNGIVPHFYEGKASGHIWFKEKDILEQTTKELVPHIGMIFQNPEAQFCTFTVEDELAFGLENCGRNGEEIKAAIEQTLQIVGMDGMEKTLLSELSGGQKQKVAIASVLVMNTEIIVLDEPTANLDAVSREEVFQLLDKLVEQDKKTIILVEHNLEHLLDKVGHVIVFDKNKKICIEGNTDYVLRSLLYDTDFEQLHLFLPEKYMIVKHWLSQMGDDSRVKAFRNKWGKYSLETESIFNEEAFVELWRTLQKTNPREVDMQLEAVPSKEKTISVDHLEYKYPQSKSQEATLRDLNFSIENGEFVALVGANGAGKSTFLNVLFGALLQYEGSVKVDNMELNEWNKKALYQKMGLVFQNPEEQFVTNVVLDELLFSLKQSSESKEEKEQIVRDTLERFYLLDAQEKSPFLLSQGQKRRLSVATMLLTGQSILFLDEPTYGQDYENQKELMKLMEELNKTGITIVVVTHDMALVADYASKVIVLSEGKTKFCGKPEEIFHNEEAIEKGKLEVPQAYWFSKRLHAIDTNIPVCFSGKKLTQYLLDRVKEEN